MQLFLVDDSLYLTAIYLQIILSCIKLLFLSHPPKKKKHLFLAKFDCMFLRKLNRKKLLCITNCPKEIPTTIKKNRKQT